jgi:Flp pilus assembly protein TadG
LFFIVMIPALLGLGALIIDGGRMLTSWREADAVADAAARSAAQELDIPDYRAGDGTAFRLNAPRARDAAQAYAQRAGYSAETEVVQNLLQVTVTGEVSLTILRFAGRDTATVQAKGEARAVRGLDEADEP